jgi:hypothetical protein
MAICNNLNKCVPVSPMKLYLKMGLVVLGSHLVRWASEHYYHQNCCGIVNSVFAWGSPACRGLRWVSDSATGNILSVAQVIAGIKYTIAG